MIVQPHATTIIKNYYHVQSNQSNQIKSVILVCLLGTSVYSNIPRLFTIVSLSFGIFRGEQPHLLVKWKEYNPCNPCHCTSSVCQQYLHKGYHFFVFLLRSLRCISLQRNIFEFSTRTQELLLSFKLIWCVFLLSNKAPTLFLSQSCILWLVYLPVYSYTL